MGFAIIDPDVDMCLNIGLWARRRNESDCDMRLITSSSHACSSMHYTPM